MNIYAFPPLISFILVFAIGLYVFFYNLKSRVHLTFGALCFSSAWWLFCFSLMYLSKDSETALGWARIGFLGIIFIPVFAYHFIVDFIDSVWGKRIVILAYLLTIPSIVLSRTDYIYSGVLDHFYGYYPIAGAYYIFFLLMFILLFAHGIVLLVISLRQAIKSKNYLKTSQIKYVLVAFLFGATGAVDYIVKFPIFIYPFGYISAILLIATVAYAILRHRLLDIEVVIKRGLVYSLLTAFLTGLFVSLILIGDQVFRGLIGFSSIWAGVIGAFVVALIFQPLRDSIQEAVDRTFFRTRYDYQRIMSRYSHGLTQPSVNLNRFSRLAPYLLTKSMKLNAASVMILDRNRHCYVVRAVEKEARDLKHKTVSEDSALVQELYLRKREISLEEVERRLKDEKELTTAERKKYHEIAAEMKRLKSFLIIPSISESEYFKRPTLLSTINLGSKLSGQSFSQEDVNFLRTLANSTTISVEYSFIVEELKKQQERVIRAEKLAAVGITTAGVAHELKNPLTYLSTVAQLLPKKWDDKEFQKNVTEMFGAEVERMHLIIEGLLDFSRTRELMLKSLDVKTVIEKALALLAYDIRKNKVEVKTDFKHKNQAMADANRLMQVFMNLMANAVQAMEGGGQLTIATQDKGKEVEVLISDTGHGIPAKKLVKVFDPFFTTKESGTGLGLYISKTIIDEHEGKITAESEEGKGTTFRVLLPTA